MENPFTTYLNRTITVQLSLRTLLLAGTGVLGLAYIALEMYWYQKVGLGVVRWHTHLFPYVAMLLSPSQTP